MDFELSEEQRLLKDSVERLTTQRYDFEARRKYMKEADGWSRALWKQYVDLGLTALPFAEEHGGVGGGPVETMIVMEAFGRALALEPYLATVVLGGGLLRRSANDAIKAELLPKVAAGETLLAFAHTERQSRYDLADVATTAKTKAVANASMVQSLDWNPAMRMFNNRSSVVALDCQKVSAAS